MQIINNFLSYKSHYFIDNQGKRHRQGTFTKYQYNPYIEMGLRDDLTFGISPIFASVSQRGKPSERALARTEIFLRQRHYKDKHWVISTQNLVGFPGSYGEDQEELLGKRGIDLEFRTLFGYSFAMWEKVHFANLETAYRFHSGTGGNELRADGSVGMRFSEKWYWLEQISSNYTFGALPQIEDNIANDINFRLVKTHHSVVHELSKRMSLQLGLIEDIYARNTGKGTGAMAAIWIKF